MAVTLLVAVGISIVVGMAAQQRDWTISAGGIGYLVLVSLMVLMFPLTALVMIGNGVIEHRRFQALRARLERMRAVAGEAS